MPKRSEFREYFYAESYSFNENQYIIISCDY